MVYLIGIAIFLIGMVLGFRLCMACVFAILSDFKKYDPITAALLERFLDDRKAQHRAKRNRTNRLG